MSDLIKLRRGTATQWSTANPVLAAGECGFDMTNNQLRIGNGTSNWSALVPINASISASDILAALVTVDGTGSGLDADTVDGRNPGSANGLATLDSASKVTSGQLPAALAMITSGTGTPEGVVTASPGGLFLRTDGGANATLYRKETGTGNTGWVASKTTIADADIASSAAIALSKLATEANNTVVGNVAGSTAVPTALTADDLQTIRNTIAFLLSTVVPSAPASAALHSEARARTLAWVTGPQGNKWPIGRAPWANTWTVIQTNNTAIRQDGHGTSSTTGSLTFQQGSTSRPPGVRITSAGTAAARASLDVGTLVFFRGATTDQYAGFEAHMSGYVAGDASYNSSGASTGSRLFPLLFYNSAVSLTTIVADDRGSTTDLFGFVRAHVNGGATDTNWQVIACGNSTTNTVDSTVPFVAGNVYDFDIWVEAGATQLKWRIGDRTAGTTQSGIVTVGMPRTTSALAVTSALTTVNATARSFDFNALAVHSDYG
jgi:hypothetical protein